MSELTLDYQPASEVCSHCKTEYMVSRGSIYEDREPLAIYLAGMHGCDESGSVILGVGVRPSSASAATEPPDAFSIQIWLVNDQYEMTLLDPAQSPWKTHSYLGRMMTRAEVLASPRKDFFFSLADCVVRQNPAVKAFFIMLERPRPNARKKRWRKRR